MRIDIIFFKSSSRFISPERAWEAFITVFKSSKLEGSKLAFEIGKEEVEMDAREIVGSTGLIVVSS